MRIVEPSVTLLALTPGPLELIERAGRVCYKSEDRAGPGTAARFVRSLVEKGHESVLEHVSASFHVVTDRAVANEWERHRLASYSQESTRFCNYSKDKFEREIQCVMPRTADGSPPVAAAYCAWERACAAAEKAYFEMLAAGEPPQIARAVLPLSLKTEFVATANLREWRHFLRMRLIGIAGTPHPQIRPLAWTVLEQFLCTEVGVCFEDLAAAWRTVSERTRG